MSARDTWSVAGAPAGPIDVPEIVVEVAGTRPVRCVWENELGGLTFELVGAGRFVKWAPPGRDLRLAEEAARMAWAGPYTPVPEVVDAGTAGDGATWLLTTALPGTSAVAPRWRASARTAVRALGEGLRAFHEALPVAECPFGWSADERVSRAHARAVAGAIDPGAWHPVHRDLTVERALALVEEPPAIDRLVVCHADACAPNTILGHDGACIGHVDLGRLGTGDRWADLAVATWSTEWNYGPGWEHELLAAYGVGLDAERRRYYRLLWDLGD